MFSQRLHFGILLSSVLVLLSSVGAQEVSDKIPKITVAEFQQLADQSSFRTKDLFGHEFTFDGVVTKTGEQPLVRIKNLQARAERLDIVRLYSPGTGLELKENDQITVRGLLLQEDFGVWSLWVYECSRTAEPDNQQETRATPVAEDDPFLGTFVKVPLLSAGSGRQIRVIKDGKFYKLQSDETSEHRYYDQYRFVRASDGQLRDEENSLGTITVGYVELGDGTKPKPRLLRVNFCYEHFLLLDTAGGGFTP